MSDEHDEPTPEPSAPLREATPAEDDLISRLSQSVGYRLLRDWEELPSDRKVLPMNRAFLSALASALGRFLGAVAVNEPDNREGWDVLLTQTLEIARLTAEEARTLAIAPASQQAADGDAPWEAPKWKRALIPEPKAVM
jgi:hypothetical protein